MEFEFGCSSGRRLLPFCGKGTLVELAFELGRVEGLGDEGGWVDFVVGC